MKSIKRGFTILEFIVIMGIISTLSVVLLGIQQKEEKKMKLGKTAFTFLQDVREVQEMAMSAETADCGENPASYSFGVYLNKTLMPSSYLLFVDCDGDRQKSAEDTVIREVQIKKGVNIFSISPSPLSVVFSPPDPLTFINGSEEATEAQIIFSLAGDSTNRRILKINTAGRIEMSK